MNITLVMVALLIVGVAAIGVSALVGLVALLRTPQPRAGGS